MGRVAETKKKPVRPATDPNNVQWTSNAGLFGQRLLRSQGWKPGGRLGSSSSDTSAAAAASIYLRAKSVGQAYADGVGLGFAPPPTRGMTFPGGRDPRMDAVELILARLNGRSEEELEAMEQSRVIAQSTAWVESKLGTMRFIYGGILSGDLDDLVPLESDTGKTVPEAGIATQLSGTVQTGLEPETAETVEHRTDGQRPKRSNSAYGSHRRISEPKSSNAYAKKRHKSDNDCAERSHEPSTKKTVPKAGVATQSSGQTETGLKPETAVTIEERTGGKRSKKRSKSADRSHKTIPSSSIKKRRKAEPDISCASAKKRKKSNNNDCAERSDEPHAKKTKKKHRSVVPTTILV